MASKLASQGGGRHGLVEKMDTSRSKHDNSQMTMIFSRMKHLGSMSWLCSGLNRVRHKKVRGSG